ncbi:Phosphoribosylamine--glycine ligase [Labilithrix luteola]|uniref:Phosphoribosylamine--glycine ligase n=1 Tax=Labilithrix luteola TaxID=1391654 RepID=A0A0K1QFA1_9BACT|nr:phosphoribosylamine--glycine ligase [Labilithrix luteola]AKV04439.1 Phosphoribosylamine--glycine ligase [Labilithrix luteola]
MKIFVVGGGGREHALVWKLSQSPHASSIHCAPGNPGIAMETLRDGTPVQCVPIKATDVDTLLDYAKRERPDLTVVGPDDPLALGLVDKLQGAGLPVWGPTQRAAQFESSKAFAQDFMQRHGIPSPEAAAFSTPEDAIAFAEHLRWSCAIKADGLALGKGVLLCRSESEAKHAIGHILEDRAFGRAGERIVIQELLEGPEISMHAFCDGTTLKVFPTSQDHKRVFDGNEGPNTGGMGAYSPAPLLDARALSSIQQDVFDRWMRGCAADGIAFCGLIYPGLVLTQDGPKVIEFNARFGDPEAQVYLPRLESDLVEVLCASIEGRLSGIDLRWSDDVVVCVVMASAGYPGTYQDGKTIHGLEAAASMPDVKVFYSGTRSAEGGVVTSGGRILGVTARAGALADAVQRAYAAVAKIQFEGAHYRRDIAAGANG